MDTNKRTILWVVVAAAVIILLIFAFKNKGSQPAPTTSNSNSANQVNSSSTTPPAASPATQTPPNSLAYTEAVQKYKDRRIQFTPTCQASPNNMTFKNPVTIMLDNRSAGTQRIGILGNTYTLSAYGYTIVTLNQSGLPKTILVDCNTSQNVAKILLEK